MLISQNKRFAFVHVPKTAGTSICEALAGMNDTAIACKLPHPPAKRIRQELGEKKWGELYKFAFVRNPWARLVSWYHAVREKPPRDLPDWRWARELPDFAAFLTTTHNVPIWRNQVDWIVDGNDEVIVDFVGRFETLQRDFASVCERLGLNAQLRHMNATSRVNYRDFYTSDHLRLLVAEKCCRDIAAFEYQF